MKLQVQFTAEIECTPEAKRHFARNLARVQANPNAPGNRSAYLAVLSKHPEGTDEDVLVASLFGETIAETVGNAINDLSIPAFGFNVEARRVQYQEATPPLAPPEDVQPYVLAVSRQHG